jgi:hypothetical protein
MGSVWDAQRIRPVLPDVLDHEEDDDSDHGQPGNNTNHSPDNETGAGAA